MATKGRGHILGTMMDDPLLLSSLLEQAAVRFADTLVIGRDVDGTIGRQTYAETDRRVRRLASALVARGVKFGDRIASLAWNTRAHFELFHAIPSFGAVLHTVNPRLSDGDIAYVIAEAGDSWLFYDAGTLPLVERVAPLLPAGMTLVFMGAEVPDTPLPAVLSMEALIREAEGEMAWPVFDERTAAVICFTSGTTGRPKGVAYSHRSTFLSALAMSLADWVGGYPVATGESFLPVASLYHSNGWQMPYTAPMNGHQLVLPGRHFDAASLVELLRLGEVSVSAGVPTVWTGIADHLDHTGEDLPHLRAVMMAGMRVPERLFERFAARGIAVQQAWGMTEAPGVGLTTPAPGSHRLAEETRRTLMLSAQGRLNVLTRSRIMDEAGAELARDGRASGLLQVKGPLVAGRYLGQDPAEASAWLDTGDIARIHPDGSIELVDRAKDVIKSGGEWISSLEIETAALTHPRIGQAAAIAADHARWQERPVLVCALASGNAGSEALDETELRAHLASQLPRWSLPDAIVFLPELPLTGTGKIDKKSLKARFAGILNRT